MDWLISSGKLVITSRKCKALQKGLADKYVTNKMDSASAPRIQLHDLLFRSSIAYHIRVFSCPSFFFYGWFYTVEIVAPVHGCA